MVEHAQLLFIVPPKLVSINIFIIIISNRSKKCSQCSQIANVHENCSDDHLNNSLNNLRSLVLRRSQSEEAVRAVWVSPDKRFDHKLCHRHYHRHSHHHRRDHHRHCRHRHHHHPPHLHHQDCPGVTSLIASTVFSFVDRESCLEETDPVISQYIIHWAL